MVGSFFDNYRHEHLVFGVILSCWNGGVVALSKYLGKIGKRGTFSTAPTFPITPKVLSLKMSIIIL